jgi:hypothetical protein
MAYMTISLQPPGAQTQQRQFQGKKRKAIDKDSRRSTNSHELRDPCALTCLHLSVAREEREHHGPYEVTVAGPFPSQSSIHSGFCGHAIFRAKAPA